MVAEFQPDVTVRERGYTIGCVGGGMIMADVHLEAYRQAGFKVAAIASRNIEKTRGIAARYGIPKVHDTPKDLIEDPSIEIVDLAYPPDLQPALVRLALKQPHVKAILIQKPLAMSLTEAIKLRDEVRASGKTVSINQNMRFDQSMRVLKQILDREELGEVVFAQIDMHAIPHWAPFIEAYDRLTFNIMSIHHMDVMRHLFGEVKEITSVARTDPRTKFKHTDGIVASTLRFKSGVMAQSLEDVWSGPRAEGYDDDIFIGWRVEGLEGVAKGTIGWPKGTPSTLTYNSRLTTGGKWVTPKWETTWFPHAFIGVMEQLQYAVRTKTKPEITIADNVKSIALIEAGYKSMAERRTVKLSEISTK